MSNTPLPLHSLVLYKKRPARLVQAETRQQGERLEIELEDGNRARVRAKDLALLHPGPLHSLGELRPLQGEVQLAWEMLSEAPGESHSLQELAELAYGEFTPASAWAAWGVVQDGLYFHGEPGDLRAHGPAEVARQQAARQARQAEAQAWAAFLQRLQARQPLPEEDRRYLRELEDLALGRRADSRILRELGRAERPENAHALLLDLGQWGPETVPYPQRLGLPLHPPEAPLPELPDERRLDLTHLPAFAIDDRGNQDPDDALSLVECHFDSAGRFSGGRLWVHIADAAALAPPGSPADLEGRARGATLYLPDGPVPMLPPAVVARLGLGLQEVSPALSFGLALDAAGEITDLEIQPSWVRVQRLSYEEAEERLNEPPLRPLYALAQAYQARRQAAGALALDLPEAILHIIDGQVHIRPLLRLRSRELVREAMLMAGEAAARYASQRRLPFPYAAQEASAAPPPAPPAWPLEDQAAERCPEDLAGSFALRRTLKRAQVSSHPAPHAGLGLPAYSRATSPLRRYLDLVAHQQLRASLGGGAPLSESEMLERLGSSEAITGVVAQAESLSRRHWTLVYFLQNPGWRGQGVLVEKSGLSGRAILPELAFETQVHLRRDLPLNSLLALRVQSVNLAELEAHFAEGAG